MIILIVIIMIIIMQYNWINNIHYNPSSSLSSSSLKDSFLHQLNTINILSKKKKINTRFEYKEISPCLQMPEFKFIHFFNQF